MEQKGNNEQVKSSVALRSGVWYTICTVIQRGISFITLPFFTRLLTKSDLGLFNTYASWISLFVMITTFDLPLSIIRSKHEFKGDENSYSFSILTLTTITNAVFLVICLCIKGWLFNDLLQMPSAFILPMFLYLFLSPAIDVFATKQRAYYKYKTYVVTTIITTVCSTAIALILVKTLSDRLAGRFLGQYLTIAAIGAIFYVIVAVQGKKVRFKYWKDGLLLCLPLMLHLVSLYILSSSDKIMITKFVGEEYTALYGVAYSTVHIATLLMSAMNRSWAPWMLDMLQNGEKEKIKKASVPYLLCFFAIVFFCMLLAPEIILVLGGKSYLSASYLMPPLFAGTLFTFVYQMYLQTEFFEKKTKYVGLATIGAAVINIVLNLWLIPRFGYIAAGYTTLIGYMFMFAFHYFYASRLGYWNIFDRKFIFSVLLAGLAIMGLTFALYRNNIIRYIIIGLIAAGFIAVLWKKRSLVMAKLKKL